MGSDYQCDIHFRIPLLIGNNSHEAGQRRRVKNCKYLKKENRSMTGFSFMKYIPFKYFVSKKCNLKRFENIFSALFWKKVILQKNIFCNEILRLNNVCGKCFSPVMIENFQPWYYFPPL